MIMLCGCIRVYMWERNVYDYGAVHLNNLQHSGDVCTSMFQLTD